MNSIYKALLPRLLGRGNFSQKNISERLSLIFTLLKNSLRFRYLNRNCNSDQLCLAPGLTLRVHEKAYYPFRYFTDFSDEMVDEMQAFLKYTKSSKTLIDVGAHYGIFSLVFSSRPGTVAYAIEPYSEAFQIMCFNSSVNPHCNIQTYQQALGICNKTVKMFVATDCDHFIVADDDSGSQSVNITTLDDFVETQKIKPDIIKIDVEGYELEVLKGSLRTLNYYGPIIFLEVHPEQLLRNRATVTELLLLLGNLGYAAYDYKGRTLSSSFLVENKAIMRVLFRK